MTSVGVYDQIKTAFQDIIAPKLHALRGDIGVLDQKMVVLDHKIVGLDQKLDGLRAETASMKGERVAEIRRLDARRSGS